MNNQDKHKPHTYKPHTYKPYTYINPYNQTTTLTLTQEEYQQIKPHIKPLTKHTDTQTP